jgi:hypothetical protein
MTRITTASRVNRRPVRVATDGQILAICLSLVAIWCASLILIVF